jgi:hypothetical protein
MFKSKHSGWTWELKRTPFGGGGGIVSAITDPISSVLGTDGSGGGILGAAASLDKAVGNTIPGGWATVGGAALMAAGIYDPTLLGMADAGTLTPEAMANAGVDQATIDSIGAQGATAAGEATGGVAVDSAGLPITADTTGVAGGTGLTGGAGATGLTSGGTVGSLTAPTTAAIDASAGLVPASGSALVGTSAGLAAPATAAAGGTGLLSSLGGGGLGTALGVTAGANVLSSLLGANASNKAAQIQANAANNASQLTANMFNIQNQQQQPYRTAGYGALNTINSMMPGQYVQYDASGNPTGAGTGTGYLTNQFNAQDLNANMSPGYAFQLDQGQRANQNAANALGGRVGGNALQGLQNYTQGFAQTSYQNAFNNYQAQRQNIYNTLAGIAGIGQTSQQQTGNLAQNANTTQAQLGVGSAAAQAAGQTGVASALTGGATGVANNLLLASLLGQNQSAAGA